MRKWRKSLSPRDLATVLALLWEKEKEGFRMGVGVGEGNLCARHLQIQTLSRENRHHYTVLPTAQFWSKEEDEGVVLRYKKCQSW